MCVSALLHRLLCLFFQIGVLHYLICAACRSRVWADSGRNAVLIVTIIYAECCWCIRNVDRVTRSIRYNPAPRDNLS